MPARKPKAKAGGLTRDQQTRALRKRDGFSTKQLIPGGLPITFDEAAGLMNLSELLHAEAQQRGGKSKRLANWTRLPASKAALEAIESATQIRAAELLRIGQGRSDSWGHPLVAVEVARWLSPPLGVVINGWWMETVNGKRKQPKANPILTNQRRATQRPFTDVLAAKGMDGAGIQRCQRQLVFEVTGKAPNVWREELGPNWMDLMPEEFQVTMAIARRFAAEQCEQLDLSEAEGFFRHFNAAFRRAAAPVRELSPYLAEIAANCDAAKALMLGTKPNP